MENLVKQLGDLIGHDKVISDPELVLQGSKDYIGFRQYERGDGKYWVPKATCVVKPQNAADASKVLAFLNDNKVDVTPRTGGSSVTMGVEPLEGGVVLDGSDMNKVVELNETDMCVTVLCGTPLEYLENYLNERGYTTGHFPQSLPMAHMGGLVATRSTGQFSTLYGGIEDLLIGLEVVLADGEVVRIKNNPRRSVGPDLRHMFIGNEGMLGFITEVTVKIFKYMPENYWMNAYAIKGMKNGLSAIREIMVQGYKPGVVRLFDDVVSERDHGSFTPEGHCLLLILADGPKSITDATGTCVDKLLKDLGAVDLGKKPVEHWLVHRNDVCKTMDDNIFYKMGVVADTCEISAPWSQIGEIHEAVLARMPNDVPTIVSIGGHSSHSYLNGTNIYFSFGATINNADEVKGIYMKIVTAIMEETLKRGGSIAHHHGSGKYRTKWMPQEHGSSYTLMRKLKEALDPNGILNKGVLLTDEAN